MTSINDQTRDISNEHRKSLIDFFKHQTTLCTATIVLVTSIVAGFFPRPLNHIFIGPLLCTTFFLLGSLGISILAYAELNIWFDEKRKWKYLTFWVLITVILFVMGLISFILSLIPLLFIR